MLGTDSARRDALPAGTSLGAYTLEAGVGQGGFGSLSGAAPGGGTAIKEYLPRGIMEVQGCFAATRSRSSDLGMHLARVATRCGLQPSGLDTLSVPRLAVGGHRRIHSQWQVRGPTFTMEPGNGSRSGPCRGFHLGIHVVDSRVGCVLGSPESAAHAQVLSFPPRITDARAH